MEVSLDHESTLRVGYVVGRLDRVFRRELSERLRPHDLTVPAYTTLSVLRRRPGLSNAQLARRSFVTPQAMSEILAQLGDRKLVSRKVDPNHNRILQTRLTARGEKVIAACERETAEIEDRMLEGISDADRARLSEMLRLCVRNLGAGL